MHLCKSHLSNLINNSWPYYVIFYLLLIQVIFAQSQDDPKDEESCVKDQLGKPEVKNRFDPGMVKEACSKRAKWQSLALNAGAKSAPILTPSQTDWADTVFQCFDLKCMCRMFDKCNHLLAQLDTPLGINGSSIVGQRQIRAISQVEQLLSQKIGKATRKEIRRLSDEERRRFFAALETLKTENIDTLSKYDIMIVQHTAEYSPGAHFSAAFLPFHREFGKSLEMALRTMDPTTALPYWDPTLDQGLPDPRDSVLWTDEFLGTGSGDVTNGPFASWTTVPDSQFKVLSTNKRIVRNIGMSPYGSLYRDADLDTIMNKKRFRDLVYCTDPFFELVHGANHLWIGGHMNELRISPNDPIFFLLHSFVDYIWEDWRQKNQDYAQRAREYTPNSDACNQFAFGSAKMRPYSINNLDGLSNQYTDVLYSYEPRPTCSQAQLDCGSPYLFCHTGKWKCLSKVRIGGNCTGLADFGSCLNGDCASGRCVTLGGKAKIDPPVATKAPELAATATDFSATVAATVAVTVPATDAAVPATANAAQKDTVWVPITVLQLNGRTAFGYPNAKIVTTMDSSEKLDGLVSDPSVRPYYTGSAFAQVKNPFGPNAQSGPVHATVEVFDEVGQKCASMCREEGTIYNPCEPNLSLMAASQQPDGVAFAQNVTLAKLLNWQGERHIPDRFLFMCPTGRSRSSPAPAPAPQPTVVPTTVVPQTTLGVTPTIAISMNGANSSGGDNIVIKVVHSSDTKATTSPDAGRPVAAAPGSASLPTATFDECRNDHRCCPVWAAVGECDRNFWMKDGCKQICGVCKLKQAPRKGCTDMHPQCAQWAKNNQCTNNDLWMEENCKRSCNVCKRSLSQLMSLCGAAPNRGGCSNQYPQCMEWAKAWECVNNPWWMKENCPEACNYCTSKLST